MKRCVVGLGKLGLPLLALLGEHGEAIGVDSNVDLIKSLNLGSFTSPEPGLQIRLSQSNVSYTTEVPEADAYFVVVPTPSDETGVFIDQFVLDAVTAIGERLSSVNDWALVTVVSTLYPQQMLGVADKLQEASGKELGRHFGLCYSPEFIAIGSVIDDMENPDFILIGESDDKSGRELAMHYGTFVKNRPSIHRMSFTEAELAKVSLNFYVTMKISYANTIASICRNLEDTDAARVLNAVGADSRVGKKYLQPSGPFAGPCFPRDVIAFCELAYAHGSNETLPEAVLAVNRYALDDIVYLIEDLPGPYAVLGLAYKPDTFITDMAPGFEVARRLEDAGKTVMTYDPLVSCSSRSANEALYSVNTVYLATDDVRWREQLPLLRDKIVIDPWNIVSDDEVQRRITLGRVVK